MRAVTARRDRLCSFCTVCLPRVASRRSISGAHMAGHGGVANRPFAERERNLPSRFSYDEFGKKVQSTWLRTVRAWRRARENERGFPKY